MQSNFSVALSGQMSLQKRLETIANNVANASTAGYRAEEVKFETLLSHTSNTPVAFASAGQSYLSRASGEIVRTDNLFDVAVQGDAWLGIQTPAGLHGARQRQSGVGDEQAHHGLARLRRGLVLPERLRGVLARGNQDPRGDQLGRISERRPCAASSNQPR